MASTLRKVVATGCRAANGRPSLVLLDLRNEPVLSETQAPEESEERTERLLAIDTPCPTVSRLFDDFLDETARREVPKDTRVVTITETGNRDDQIQAFFFKYGYENLEALRFGMRGWIKELHPVGPVRAK